MKRIRLTNVFVPREDDTRLVWRGARPVIVPAPTPKSPDAIPSSAYRQGFRTWQRQATTL